MSKYRTEKSGDEKKPVWIDPELHREIKLYCVQEEISIKDFTETALQEALQKKQGE